MYTVSESSGTVASTGGPGMPPPMPGTWLKIACNRSIATLSVSLARRNYTNPCTPPLVNKVMLMTNK